MMSLRQIAVLVLALSVCGGTALGVARSGGDYSITEDSLDGGGLRTAGAPYDIDASLCGIGGVSTGASPNQVLKSGYLGQLTEATNVVVRASPSPMNEDSFGQLDSTAEFDDGTVLTLTNGETKWLAPAFPFVLITPDDTLQADVVYADTAGAVTGTYFDAAGSVALTVLNWHPDNFKSYAGDGIADTWQVDHFGVENPDALAGSDPDEDLRDNRHEYVAGTDPNDDASYFRLWDERVANVSTQVDVLYHPRLDDRLYEVQRCTDLLDIAWNANFDSDQSLNNATCTVRDLNIPTESMYYRVKISGGSSNCGFFVAHPLPPTMAYCSYDVALADFNKDGTLDMFIGNDGPAQVLFTIANGFYPVITNSGQRLGTGVVYGVAAGDLNGDTNVDVFAAGPEGGRIWYNNGAGMFTGSTLVVTNPFCTAAAIGDLNSDGINDLFVSRGSAAAGYKDVVLTNNGAGLFSFVDQPAFILDRSYDVALADLDNDGDLDAYVANSVANRRYRNDGQAHFSLWGSDSRSDDSRGVAIADLNGDGWRDIVVANSWPGPSVVYLCRTNGAMDAFPLVSDWSDGSAAAAADLNGDLRPDIVIAGWGNNAVWFNVDGTNFSRGIQPMGDDMGQSVAAGRVNDDSAMDFVIVNYDTTNTLWLNECLP